MKIKRKIEVTLGDIRKGDPSEVYSCPIALAIKRTLRIETVYISEEMAEFIFNGVGFDLHLPKKACKFIERFDDEEKVRPFAFVLQGDGE